MGARQYLFAGLIVGLVVAGRRAGRHAVGRAAAGVRRRRRPASSRRRAPWTLLRVIAAEPRAIGSPRAAVVRDFIYGRLEALALEPARADGRGGLARASRAWPASCTTWSAACRAATPRAPCCSWRTTTPCPRRAGAADDGSGVAALLETARALRAGPPPRNDVIFLFTDGEERGLLGSQAFLARGPVGLRRRRGPQLRQRRARRRRRSCTRRARGNGLLIAALPRRRPRRTARRSCTRCRAGSPWSATSGPSSPRGIPGMTLRHAGRPGLRPHRLRLARRRSTRRACSTRARPRSRWRAGSATPTSGSCTPPTSSTSTSSGASPCRTRARGSLPFVRAGRWRSSPPPSRVAARRRLLTPARRRLGGARHGRHAGRLAARRRHRLDDVPDRLRGARLDGHRRRDQRLVPARARAAGGGRRAGHLRGAAAPAARLGPRRRRARRGGRPAARGREPRVPGRQLPAHVVARGRRRWGSPEPPSSTGRRTARPAAALIAPRRRRARARCS